MDETMDKKIEPNAGAEETEEVVVRYKEMSPMMMVARRFFRSPLSLIGVIMLVALFMFAFLGPSVMHICGHQWEETETDHTPTVKRAGFILQAKTKDAEGNEHEVYQFVEKEVGINSYAPMSSSHPLGTDEKGMDVFVRLMYGGRVSLTLGFVVVILETILGIILGGIAGYFGGKLDQIIMRVVDMVNCIPASHSADRFRCYRFLERRFRNADLLSDADHDHLWLERNRPYGKRTDPLPA